MLPCSPSSSCRSEKTVLSKPFGPKNPISKSRSIPIPHITVPLSTWCSRAAASRLGKRSSPSESFTNTVSRSRRVSMNSPGQQGFGLDPKASIHRLGEFFRIAEGRIYPTRPTGLDEVHHILEIPVVAQGELRVDPVSPGEIEHGAPSAHIRGPEADRTGPRNAFFQGGSEPSPGQDERPRTLPSPFPW